jgi:hypothetical protein
MYPDSIAQPRDIITRGEAARLLGVMPGTLARWAATNRYQLPVIRYGKRTAGYLRADVLHFRDQHREVPGTSGHGGA